MEFNSSSVYDALTFASAQTATASAGIYWIKDETTSNNKNNMEIGKKENFKIVLRETRVKDYTYGVLAKDKESALEIIKNNSAMCSSETVSVEVVEVK